MRKKIIIDCRRILNSGIGRVTEWLIQNVCPFLHEKYHVVYLVNDVTKNDYSLQEKECIVVNIKPLSVDEFYILPQIIIDNHCDLFISPQINVSPFHLCKTINMLHDLWYINSPCYLPTEEDMMLRFKNKTSIMGMTSLWLTQTRAKMLLTDYGYSKWEEAMSLQNNMLCCMWSQISMFSVFSSEIVCVSKAVEEDFKKVFRRNTNICTIENSLSYDWFNLKQELRDNRYFLCLAKLEERKKLLALLDAYSSYCKRVENPYHLKIAGDYGYDSYAKKVINSIMEINNSNNGHYVEYIESAKTNDVKKLITGSSLLVHPSEYESFGYPPLEAMAAGIPVFATNTGQMKTSIGDYVTKFDISDINQLADLLVKFDRNPSLFNELANKAKTVLKDNIENETKINLWVGLIAEILR